MYIQKSVTITLPKLSYVLHKMIKYIGVNHSFVNWKSCYLSIISTWLGITYWQRNPKTPPHHFPNLVRSLHSSFISPRSSTATYVSTGRKIVFCANFASTWMHHSKHLCHSKHSCHIKPFSCHIGHFLSFWTMSQKTMLSTSAPLVPISHSSS